MCFTGDTHPVQFSSPWHRGINTGNATFALSRQMNSVGLTNELIIPTFDLNIILII